MIFSVCSCIVNPAAEADIKRFVWAVGNFEIPIGILEMAAVNTEIPPSEMKTPCRQAGCSKAHHIPRVNCAVCKNNIVTSHKHRQR